MIGTNLSNLLVNELDVILVTNLELAHEVVNDGVAVSSLDPHRNHTKTYKRNNMSFIIISLPTLFLRVVFGRVSSIDLFSLKVQNEFLAQQSCLYLDNK